MKVKRFFPSLLLIALVSHVFIYYYGVYFGEYREVAWLVSLALFMLFGGYYVGTRYRLVFRKQKTRVIKTINEYRPKTIRLMAFLLILIGFLAHVLFYSLNPITSYGDSYTAGRGSGFITVFFYWWVIGMILLEFLSERGKNSKRVTFMNRMLMVVYVVLYFFVFLKRRQIILLGISILGIWNHRFSRKTKVRTYTLAFVGFVIFSVFGKARGYIDTYGFSTIGTFISSDFSWEWFAVSELEGKYISRTLRDVYHYAQTIGYDPSILVGVFFSLVPRALLGGTKPLAFPEWYTKHFHPIDFQRGTGYAGSMVGELYLIGGVLFVIIGYAAFGYICGRVQKQGVVKREMQAKLMYSIFVYNVLIMPRYDLASFLIDAIFLYLPILFVFKVSRKKSTNTEAI